MDVNDTRFIEIGLKIAYYRNLKHVTQEALSEQVGISTGHLSHVESPSTVQPVSLKTLFAIADALGVAPYKFLLFDNETP